ncbi:MULTISPECIES: hypothetical protein [Rhodanobacter]|uniref:hypothetical protein n=1 Tax=Rhodanobacter TaxID=75309 RepID=UPI00122791C2|nr:MULTISPECIES: hypothetical protein [Rhodanobacter]TAN14484.1 MAG: hypothetical protein EPN35_15785 [Rhodanobacter sp.]UJJ56110.1 hypothetical protein LRK53_06980 [Rhodanobacter thiooxydans]
MGEGYATLNNVAAQQEVYNSTGLNIGVASANQSVNVPQYKEVYNNYMSGGEGSYDAAQQIGAIYRNGEIPGGDQTIPVGTPFTTNGSYGTHYFNGFLNIFYNWSHK